MFVDPVYERSGGSGIRAENQMAIYGSIAAVLCLLTERLLLALFAAGVAVVGIVKFLKTKK